MSEDDETFQHDFEPDPDPRRRWRPRGLRGHDRVAALRGAVAVGLAGLVLGGTGGYALHAASADDRPGDAPGRVGRPLSDGGPEGHPPPGAPGQLPPGIGEEHDRDG